jgi:hypothetical protein
MIEYNEQQELLEAKNFFFGEKIGIHMMDLCDKIAEQKFLKWSNGNICDNPIDIYNYSSSGELFMIFWWFIESYHIAKQKMQ